MYVHSLYSLRLIEVLGDRRPLTSVLRAAHSSHIFVFRFYPEARRVHFPVI